MVLTIPGMHCRPAGRDFRGYSRRRVIFWYIREILPIRMVMWLFTQQTGKRIIRTLIHILMWKKLHTDIMVWATVIGVLFVRTGAKQFPIILKTLCHRMCPIQQRICMRKSVLPILQNVDMSWGNRAAPCR